MHRFSLTAQLRRVGRQVSLADHFHRLQSAQERQAFDEALLNTSRRRVQVAKFVYSSAFKFFMAMCVFLSIGIIIHETDSKAADEDIGEWTKAAPMVLLFIYTLECALRLYVSGHKFFLIRLNILDLVLVVLELAAAVFEHLISNLPNVMVIRFFKLMRLARLSSILMRFRPLYMIVQGFFGAMQAIFFATILVLIVLSLWSIISVEFLHPLAVELSEAGAFANCDRCSHAYSSVMESNLTYLQTMIVGDSWNLYVMPLIERDWRASVIFCGVFITIQVGMLNLILAVIVDSAAQARQNDEQRLVHEKKSALKTAHSRFYKLCEKMDTNESGTLSEQELFDGMTTEPEFSTILTTMDITEGELGVLFKMMDVDRCGEVRYDDFTEMLHRFRNDDMRTHIMFLKHYVLEVTSMLDENLGKSLRKLEARSTVRAGQSVDHSGSQTPRAHQRATLHSQSPSPQTSYCRTTLTSQSHTPEAVRTRVTVSSISSPTESDDKLVSPCASAPTSEALSHAKQCENACRNPKGAAVPSTGRTIAQLGAAIASTECIQDNDVVAQRSSERAAKMPSTCTLDPVWQTLFDVMPKTDGPDGVMERRFGVDTDGEGKIADTLEVTPNASIPETPVGEVWQSEKRVGTCEGREAFHYDLGLADGGHDPLPHDL